MNEYRLPRAYTASQLVAVYRFVRGAPDDAVFVTPDSFRMNRHEWLGWFRKCLHTKINRGLPTRGRKDCPDWYWLMWRTAREVNTPRLAIHWLPYELRHRLAHRLSEVA